MMRKALVVGINEYPSAPLYGCVRDATVFSELIGRDWDGKLNFDVTLKLNVGTKAKLREHIKTLFSSNEETVLFYYSGHGFVNELGGYIVTPDSRQYDEGVSMDEILSRANASKALHKIIILDCCNAGAFGEFSGYGDGKSLLSEGVTILAASRKTEPAVEKGGHGVFTALLLEALNGGAADVRGLVTPASVYAFIDQSLGAWYQRPVFKTNVCRFSKLRVAQPIIAENVLRNLPIYFSATDALCPLDPTHEFTNTAIAVPDNVRKLKELQQMAKAGLVVPENFEFMYEAAQHSSGCRLTAYGAHYWRLVSEKLF